MSKKIDKLFALADKSDAPSESDWSAKLCRKWRDQGAFVYRNVGNFRSGAGIPDATICYNRMTLWIEFKGQKTRLEKVQKECIRRLKKAGAHSFVYRYPNLLQDEDGNLVCIIEPKDFLVSMQKLCVEEHILWLDAAKALADVANQDIQPKCDGYHVVYRWTDKDGNQREKEMGTLWHFMLKHLNFLYDYFKKKGTKDAEGR